MTEIKKLLEIRKEAKKRKPLFVRRDSRYKSRVSPKWRKPRGKQSPVRQKHKGRQKLVSVGYGSPKEVKHLHSSGLEKVVIHNQMDLEKIDSGKQGIIISSKVGNKKKIELIKLALEKELTILNLKSPQAHFEKLEQKFQKRKKAKKKKTTEKEQKEIEKKKIAEEKEKKEKEEADKKKADEAKEKAEVSEGGKIKEPKPELTPEEKEKREAEKNIIKKQ